MYAECPLKVRNSAPVATSHSLTVWSQLPLTRVLPSGLNAIDMTKFECPVCTTSSGFCAQPTTPLKILKAKIAAPLNANAVFFIDIDNLTFDRITASTLSHCVFECVNYLCRET